VAVAAAVLAVGHQRVAQAVLAVVTQRQAHRETHPSVLAVAAALAGSQFLATATLRT